MTEYFPYWWQDRVTASSDEEKMTLPDSVDYLIVGGGYAGLAAGLTLAKRQCSVLICEGGILGQAAATRNAGICSGNLYVSHGKLSQQFGKDYADQMYLEGAKARQDLRHFCEQHRLDCDYQLSGRVTCALSAKDYKVLSQEAERLAKLAGYDVQMIPKAELVSEIAGTSYVGGMLRRDIGGFHPAKFYDALLKQCRQEGVKIVDKTWVKSIRKMQNHQLVETGRGKIKAGKVLVTSNAYTQGKFPVGKFLSRRLVNATSGIVVTEDLGEECVKNLMPRLRMFGDTSRLYNYFRPTPDHRRILLGSRSDEHNQATHISRDYLHHRLTNIFSCLKKVKIDYCWTGQVAFFQDFMPRIFVHDDVYYTAGYAGSGTVWARWFGIQAAQYMLDGECSTSFIMPPPKAIPLYYGRAWFMPSLLRYYQFQDLLKKWKK